MEGALAGAPSARVEGHRIGTVSGLAPDVRDALDRYWRAANYLSVGQIYLLDNPLLERGLEAEDIKPRLLGHWGTTPGLNLVYAHLNRLIRERDVNAIFLAGPGHGGPAAVANAWLEGTYSEVYPAVGYDAPGLRALFRQFSFPGVSGATWLGMPPGKENWVKSRFIPGSSCEMSGQTSL